MASAEIRPRQRRGSKAAGALAPATQTPLSFQPTRDTLDELAALPEDWDSYGASPPTARAISAAHGVLANVAERYVDVADEHALPWATAPLADGGVQFEWRGPGGAIEVEIGPDGALNYLVEWAEQTVERSAPGSSARLEEVLAALGRVLRR